MFFNLLNKKSMYAHTLIVVGLIVANRFVTEMDVLLRDCGALYVFDALQASTLTIRVQLQHT